VWNGTKPVTIFPVLRSDQLVWKFGRRNFFYETGYCSLFSSYGWFSIVDNIGELLSHLTFKTTNRTRAARRKKRSLKKIHKTVGK